MAALHDDMFDATLYAKEALARDTKARIDMLATQAMSGGILTVDSTSSITGARAEWIVMDDIYESDSIEDYNRAMTQIEIATKHIQRSVEALDHLHGKRYQSPYHPMHLIRWGQKRSTRFWIWASLMPIILPIMAFLSLKSYDDLHWAVASMLTYGMILAVGSAIRWIK